MKIQMIVAAIIGLLAVGSAQAEGFYVGAGVQTTRLGVDYLPLGEADATGGRIYAGYAFHPQFAAELSYLNSGWASWQGPGYQYDLRAQVMALSLVGAFPISEQWSLFGKVGFYDGTADEQGWASGYGSAAFSEDIDGMTLGAGLRYDIGRFAWRLEYDWFDVDYGSAKSLGLNAQVRF